MTSPFSFLNAKYDAFLGFGGIGTGLFYELKGNATLGRNESRLAKKIPGRDYCKGHIICHYLATFLPQVYNVSLLSAIGSDKEGDVLLEEAKKAGIDIRHIKKIKSHPTLNCVCIQYEDKSCANISERHSAPFQIKNTDVSKFFDSNITSQAMVLCVPEVPLNCRLKLLEKAAAFSAYNIVSLVNDEVCYFVNKGGLKNTSLLSLNVEEAIALTGLRETHDINKVFSSLSTKVFAENPDCKIILSLGEEGVMAADKFSQVHLESLKVPVKASGGAGDALLAGICLGLWAGLPLMPENDKRKLEESPLDSAIEMGVCLASFSLQSYDTINFSSSAKELYDFIISYNLTLSTNMKSLFWDINE